MPPDVWWERRRTSGRLTGFTGLVHLLLAMAISAAAVRGLVPHPCSSGQGRASTSASTTGHLLRLPGIDAVAASWQAMQAPTPDPDLPRRCTRGARTTTTPPRLPLPMAAATLTRKKKTRKTQTQT
ncbi:hypothetical protein HDK77DRAFT_445775 [Phyllosticta capitalensis]